MTSDVVASSGNTQSVWNQIERDFTLRLSLIAGEWSSDYLKAWNGIFAEAKKRGNSGYYGHALVEMAIADMDKRAKWSYETCCATWEMQGRSKTSPFFRAVFDWCIQPMFAVRKGCFTHQLELHQKRTGSIVASNLSHIGGHLAREMGKLKARWNTLLEIATRDAEHQERLKRECENKAASQALKTQGLSQTEQAHSGRWQTAFISDPSRAAASGSPFSWRDLEIRFQEVQAKSTPQETVNIEWTRTEFETGAISQEWTVRGNLGLKAEFEALASIAAQKLGYAQNECACNEWLGRVRAWMRESRLDKDRNFVWNTTGSFTQDGVSADTQAFISTSFADLSAKFCINLMAQGAPETAVLRQANKAPAAVQAKSSSIDGRVSKTRKQSRRTAVIFGAIQSRLKGSKYCKALDDPGLRPPDAWTEEGCPRTYAQAYREQNWRIRIQNEKYRFGKQYNVTTIRERETIIQSLEITRRTRV